VSAASAAITGRAAAAPLGETPVALRAPSVSPTVSSTNLFSTTFIHRFLPALYSKLSLPNCLTLIGREGPNITKPVVMSGNLGDDAKRYQVRAVQLAIEESRK
jgi:hypothetical protein